MSWTQPVFEAVARLVGERAGLKLTNRSDSAELSIRRAMTRVGMTDAGSYLQSLAGDHRLFDDLISDLTVGETYFFREPEQFQRIRRDVLPDIRRRRGPDHLVRAWSAGCASGEEAYTLAMIFEQEGLGQQFHVLATDISQKALTAARRGTYTGWSLRGNRGTDALPYLIRTGASYKVADTIRQHVSFAPLNLALDVFPSFVNGTWGMDLILCRNVLIYFDPDTVQSVARRLFQSLVEGGWLLTASADPPLWDRVPFEVVAAQQGIAYRRPITTEERRGVSGEVAKELEREPWSVEREPWSVQEALRSTPHGPRPTVHAPTPTDSFAAALLRVRALANLEPLNALAECERLLPEAPFSAELNYLRAMLLLDLGQQEQALQAVKRVIYLDRSLAIAHFTLALMLRQCGDREGARRAYRNARDLSAGLPADAVLPLGEGELAGRLAETAAAETLSLEDGP